MKLLLFLLPLLSVVRSAPLGEQAAPLEGLEDLNTRVKKAQEFAMYNEQNAPHETEKRSDPSELEDESIDLTGDVKANEPTDIQEADESDDTDQPESADMDSEVADNVEPLSADENSGDNDNNDLNSEEIVAEETPGGVSSELEESSKSEESNFPDVEGTEDYLSNYKQMLGALANKPYPNERWGQLYDDQPYYGYPTRSRFQRYRRSQNRRFNNVPLLRRAVKRSRRIKRDLFYPGSGLPQEYDPYDDSYLVDPYETYQPTGNEELISLLDLLDNARQYDDEDNYGNYLGNGYELPEENLEDLVYEEEPKYYVPKRQAGLTFVPGIKRSRPFYPYYEEPETHFSAFVPKKRTFRDYEDEYERVMRLAAALRDAQSEYPDDYGYQLYRRRK